MLIGFTVGLGFTVIVNVIGVPVQGTPPMVTLGVTVIVAVIGMLTGLEAVKAGNAPIPEAGRPMATSLLVQVKTAPGLEELNGMELTATPLQNSLLVTALISGGVQICCIAPPPPRLFSYTPSTLPDVSVGNCATTAPTPQKVERSIAKKGLNIAACMIAPS